MAGDWIAMRLNIASDPAVIGIAADTGLDEFGVVGRLHCLWAWANEHTTNGHAPSVTEKWIDRLVGVTCFAQAMMKAGWLNLNDDGSVTLPKFDSWNSQGAKRRLLAAKRKKRERSDGHASGSKASRLQRDKSVTREEKRREENKEPPNPPAGGERGRSTKPRKPSPEEHPLFARFWSVYPRKVGKPQAARSFARLAPDEALLARMLAAIAGQSRSDQWQRDGGQFIPHPTTWLNGRRWEDEPPAPPPVVAESVDDLRERERCRMERINAGPVGVPNTLHERLQDFQKQRAEAERNGTHD